MTARRIPLRRAAAWSPEPLHPAPSGFVRYAHGAPDASAVEPILRRRLSPLGRGLIHCAARAGEGEGPLRAVFASRHGEPARAMPMLEDLAAGLDISPTQFSMNVLNAVAGVWSIARRDTSAATALSAGTESFGWGLLEAWSLHEAHRAPVLFVFGDDALPESLAGFADDATPLHALALLIAEPAEAWLVVDRDPLAEARMPEDGLSRCALRALSGEPAAWLGPRGAWSFRLE